MPFCSKCGAEVPENIKFCPKCGNALQESKSPSPSESGNANAIGNGDAPALWNPKAAVWWSGLFLPLGPILHYLNWKSLGKNKEANRAKMYAIVFGVIQIIWFFIPEELIPSGVNMGVCVGLLAGWLTWGWGWFITGGAIKRAKEKGEPLATGKEQAEYVAEKYGTGYKRKSWLAPLAISFGIYGIIIFVVGFCLESQEISTVKKGSLKSCPYYTVEELVDNFMDKPRWEHIVTDNDLDYVNISGIITVYGRPANGLLQFWLRNDIFGFQAFEINGNPQNAYMASVLIGKMCESAEIKLGKTNNVAKTSNFITDLIEEIREFAMDKYYIAKDKYYNIRYSKEIAEAEAAAAQAAAVAAAEAEEAKRQQRLRETLDKSEARRQDSIAAAEQAAAMAKESTLLTDSRDGKTYKTAKIGTQTWMAENLSYNASGSKCYDDNSANCQKYGRFYNWATAKKACPSGWHLPTNGEWDALYRNADGTSGRESPYSSETAGKYLKAKSGWNNSDGKPGNGLDSYGFAALPGGSGAANKFHLAGENGYWWSDSESDKSKAYYRFIPSESDAAGFNNNAKSLLFNVRCLKD